MSKTRLPNLTLPPFTHSLGSNIFIGCSWASFCLVLLDLLSLDQNLMQGLSPQAKSVLYLYTASPTLLVGIGSGLILGTLFFLTHWGSHGRWKDPFQQNASFNAFPIALLALCTGVGFTLGFYSMNQPLNRSYGAYLWLLPNLAIAAYLWHILRLFFIYVDHRFQK
jgi:hypothetical protein